MSLDIDTDTLEEEFEEELEKRVGVVVMNQIRKECEEEPLVCKESA